VPAATTVVTVLSMLLAGFVSLGAVTVAMLVKSPVVVATTSTLMSHMVVTGIVFGYVHTRVDEFLLQPEHQIKTSQQQ